MITLDNDNIVTNNTVVPCTVYNKNFVTFT